MEAVVAESGVQSVRRSFAGSYISPVYALVRALQHLITHRMKTRDPARSVAPRQLKLGTSRPPIGS
jgi:hypothetical protein